jgi:hypothetical protein
MAKAIAWMSATYAKPVYGWKNSPRSRAWGFDALSSVQSPDGDEPLQFQKQLRLRIARERMLRDGLDATSAAYEMGYESVSQFNREYSRFLSQPPMRDIKGLRDGKVVAIDAA